MPYPSYSPNEVESRGESIYEMQIRPIVEAGNRGKFVVIDIESGDYELDADDLIATKRLLAKQPAAVVYGVRVGHRAAYTLGAQSARDGR